MATGTLAARLELDSWSPQRGAAEAQQTLRTAMTVVVLVVPPCLHRSMQSYWVTCTHSKDFLGASAICEQICAGFCAESV